MAMFTAVQPIGDTFLFFLPFYYSAKLGFACYLWYNNLAGAELVYTRYIQPFISHHEPTVDEKIAEARSIASQLVSSNLARGAQWVQSMIVAALAQTHQAAANVSGPIFLMSLGLFCYDSSGFVINDSGIFTLCPILIFSVLFLCV